MKHRYSKRAIALVIATGLWVVLGGLAAFANHDTCRDEPPGQPINAGTQDTYVSLLGFGAGMDLDNLSGDEFKTCNWDGSETTVYTFTVENTGTPGLTVQWDSCAYSGENVLSCQTELDTTGASIGTATPSTDSPGGGTVGAGGTATGQCIWVDGVQQLPSCSPGSAVSVSVAEGDLPTATPVPPCALNLNEGPCEVNNYKVTIGGDTGTTDADKTVVVSRQNIGGTGTTSHDQPQTCLKTTPSLSCS